MYQTCAFETAWNEQKQSPWCLPFSIEAMKVIYVIYFLNLPFKIEFLDNGISSRSKILLD